MASFQLSPGVIVKEEDLTNVIPAVATSIGATVIDAQWGPIGEIRIVDGVDRLVSRFGQPVTRNYKDWFSAWNFLAYSKDMRIVRVAHDGTLAGGIANATDLNGGVDLATNTVEWVAENSDLIDDRIYVKNSDHFDDQKVSLAGAIDVVTPANALKIVARYAGTKGNDIKVAYSSESDWANFKYKNLFDFAPAADSGEFALVVLDGNTIIEKWFLGALIGTRDEEGNSIYAGSVLNSFSKYIRIIDDNFLLGDQATVAAAIAASSWAIGTGNTDTVLLGGEDNQYSTYAEYKDNIQAGWDIFVAQEHIEINLLITGGADADTAKYVVQNIAGVRKDCVAFVSPHQEDVVNNNTPAQSIVERRHGTGGATTNNLNVNTSYGFMDGNYKYQYDPYNEVFRWVPLNGDMAGLAARTDTSNDPWWSFAGLNRGQIKNVVKFAFTPSRAQRDELYKNSINPVLSFPGEGAVLFGDRTMLIRPSAFRHINVRRLFIILEKAIATAAKYTLFEFNDEFTRTRFVQQVEPFLRDIQSRRGIIANDLGKDGFYVVADERVNTPEVINNNEFRARIMIKPARSINFIELTFTAVNNGVDFEEIIVPAST